MAARPLVLIATAFLILIAFAATTQASGLKVAPSSVQVSKIAGQPSNFTLEVQNQELFEFLNISFETNPYAAFPRIPALAAGSSINVTASITSDTPASGQTIRIKGYYDAQVGPGAHTVPVEVTQFQSTPCDITITRGDTVSFTSRLLSDITMIDADTQLPVDGMVIQNNQTKSKTFGTAQTLRYYFSVSNFPFPQTCVITVLADTGLVNDPQLDALFVLNTSVLFPPTNLSATAPVTNYTLNFFETQDGVLTVTNTGNNPARSVRMSGEWLSFSISEFDLSQGQTRAVSYSVVPLITQTNQTNRTYTKNIGINGNFPSISIPLTVHIPFAQIGDNASDVSSLKDFLGEFCIRFPHSQFCDPEPQVIFRGFNGTGGGEVTVNYTQEQIRTMQISQLESLELEQTRFNFLKEQLTSMELRANQSEANQGDINSTLKDLSEKQRKASENSVMTFGLFGGLIAIAIIAALIYIYREKKQEKGAEW